MKIEEHLGDLKKIDISYVDHNIVYLILVTVGHLDGSPQMQTALLDKLQGYLEHTQSDWFVHEYSQMSVKIIIGFEKMPDELILQLLFKCISWCADYNVELLFELDKKPFRIKES